MAMPLSRIVVAKEFDDNSLGNAVNDLFLAHETGVPTKIFDGLNNGRPEAVVVHLDPKSVRGRSSADISGEYRGNVYYSDGERVYRNLNDALKAKNKS